MCESNKSVRLTCLMTCLLAVLAENTENNATEGKAKVGTLPYRVDLRCVHIVSSHAGYKSFCGGALIADNKVLTAAECVVIEGASCSKPFKEGDKFINTDGKYVVASALKRVLDFEEKETQWRRIKSVLVPKNYTVEKTNIAVVFTVKKFELNKNVAILPYASKKIDYAAVGAKCMTSGYGSSDGGSIEELSYGDIKVLNDTINKTPATFIITETEKSLYDYDTGAPLVCWNTTDPAQGEHGLIVGVNANTLNCHNNTVIDHGNKISIRNIKSVCGPKFSRASSYYDFITNKSMDMKGNLSIYCFIFILCQNFVAIM